MSNKEKSRKPSTSPKPGYEHPFDKWFGTSKNDRYWEDFLAAIKRERAKSQRMARRGRK